MKELSSIERNLNILFPQSYKNTLDKFKLFMEIEFKDYEGDVLNLGLKIYTNLDPDIQKSVLSYALDKVLETDVPNIKLLWVDGDSLTNYFEDGEIDQLYLNFSDPWPKKRHEKRRLTYKSFLDTFKQILPEYGEIHFKTDNRGLFEYSLVSFSQYGMTLKGVWLDLHASDFEGNVMTEYEKKFSSKGQVIYRVEAQF